MGCPLEVVLEENLVFSICTHDPDTGVLTDTDSAPVYRVYEDETGTAITDGVMAKLDDANTTGFYTELIACTALNGYEYGKTYTVYVEAIVDGDKGGISYGFRVRRAYNALLDDSLLDHTTAGTIGNAVGSLPQRIVKNQALADFPFLLVDSSDHVSAKTGVTVTAERSLNGAAFAACTNAVSELSNGIYTIDLSAADLNGDTIVLKFSGSGADTRYITVVTQE